MSKYKEVLEEVKKLVFGEEVPTVETETKVEENAEEVTKENFVAITLSDGTLLQVEPDVQIGASVLIEDPEMGMIAVPDGAYELEDGRIINVMGGLVESVEEVAAAEDVEEEMETESNAEPKMTEKEVRKIIESVETHFKSEVENFKSEIEKLQNELTQSKEETKAINEKFLSALEELSETPSEEPKTKVKTGFNFPKKSRKGVEALINYKNKK